MAGLGDKPSLWLGGVPGDVTEVEVRDVFQSLLTQSIQQQGGPAAGIPVPTILTVKVLREKSCGFVNFGSVREADEALKISSRYGLRVHNQYLKVCWSSNRGQKPPSSSPSPAPSAVGAPQQQQQYGGAAAGGPSMQQQQPYGPTGSFPQQSPMPPPLPQQQQQQDYFRGDPRSPYTPNRMNQQQQQSLPPQQQHTSPPLYQMAPPPPQQPQPSQQQQQQATDPRRSLYPPSSPQFPLQQQPQQSPQTSLTPMMAQLNTNGADIDPKQREMIESTAHYVAKNGPSFEEMMKKSGQQDKKFEFLLPGGRYSEYYRARLAEERMKLQLQPCNLTEEETKAMEKMLSQITPGSQSDLKQGTQWIIDHMTSAADMVKVISERIQQGQMHQMKRFALFCLLNEVLVHLHWQKQDGNTFDEFTPSLKETLLPIAKATYDALSDGESKTKVTKYLHAWDTLGIYTADFTSMIESAILNPQPVASPAAAAAIVVQPQPQQPQPPQQQAVMPPPLPLQQQQQQPMPLQQQQQQTSWGSMSPHTQQQQLIQQLPTYPNTAAMGYPPNDRMAYAQSIPLRVSANSGDYYHKTTGVAPPSAAVATTSPATMMRGGGERERDNRYDRYERTSYHHSSGSSSSRRRYRSRSRSRSASPVRGNRKSRSRSRSRSHSRSPPLPATESSYSLHATKQQQMFPPMPPQSQQQQVSPTVPMKPLTPSSSTLSHQ